MSDEQSWDPGTSHILKVHSEKEMWSLLGLHFNSENHYWWITPLQAFKSQTASSKSLIWEKRKCKQHKPSQTFTLKNDPLSQDIFPEAQRVLRVPNCQQQYPSQGNNSDRGERREIFCQNHSTGEKTHSPKPQCHTCSHINTLRLSNSLLHFRNISDLGCTLWRGRIWPQNTRVGRNFWGHLVQPPVQATATVPLTSGCFAHLLSTSASLILQRFSKYIESSSKNHIQKLLQNLGMWSIWSWRLKFL